MTEAVSGAGTPLWDGPAPGSEHWTDQEQWTALDLGNGLHEVARNVAVPTLTAYLPEVPTTDAVLVLPGGAMHFLDIEREGRRVAELLTSRGLAAFVVKYRLVPTPTDDADFSSALLDAFAGGLESAMEPALQLAVADARRALDLVSARGYSHVTALGFSAGARVLAAQIFAGGRAPDAVALLYLPSVAKKALPEAAPPAFVAAAADDPLGVQGSLDITTAWRAAGRPVELHMFERGGHGFAVDAQRLPSDLWPELFLAWHHSQHG